MKITGVLTALAAAGFPWAVLHCGTRTSLDIDGPSTTTAADANGDGPIYYYNDAGQLVTSLPDGRVEVVDSSTDGCGDTTASPANCGACGHDCQGGACMAGVCQPILLTDAEYFPTSIAYDDTNLYWVNQTDIDYGDPPASVVVRAMPKRGGTPTTLDTVRPGVPTSLHRNGKNLYYYRSIDRTLGAQNYQGSIVRMCTDGSCPRTEVKPLDNYPWNIVLDDTNVYFPSSLTGGLSQVAQGGGAPISMTPYVGFYITRLATDDTSLYAFAVPNPANAGKFKVMVLKSGKTAGSSWSTVLEGLVQGGDVMVDDTSVYISDTKQIVKLAKAISDAGAPTTLSTAGNPGYLAMDEKRIYWLEFSAVRVHTASVLHWVGKDGTGEGSIELTTNATQAPGLVVDDTSVYWAALLAPLAAPLGPRGGIMKCVKPL